jgi:hypothetical protein
VINGHRVVIIKQQHAAKAEGFCED